MKLINKILLGITIIMGLISSTQIKDLDELQWMRSGHIEKVVKFTLGASELAGDSIIFYKGQPAVLTEVYVKSRMRGTAYTASTTDTIKIYGNYGSVGSSIAYIADSLFVTDLPLVSSTGITTGILTGTEYSIGIPTGKFTTGNNLIDVYAKLSILK